MKKCKFNQTEDVWVGVTYNTIEYKWINVRQLKKLHYLWNGVRM